MIERLDGKIYSLDKAIKEMQKVFNAYQKLKKQKSPKQLEFKFDHFEQQ